jgi:hypothetical protein
MLGNRQVGLVRFTPSALALPVEVEQSGKRLDGKRLFHKVSVRSWSRSNAKSHEGKKTHFPSCEFVSGGAGGLTSRRARAEPDPPVSGVAIWPACAD